MLSSISPYVHSFINPWITHLAVTVLSEVVAPLVAGTLGPLQRAPHSHSVHLHTGEVDCNTIGWLPFMTSIFYFSTHTTTLNWQRQIDQ